MSESPELPAPPPSYGFGQPAGYGTPLPSAPAYGGANLPCPSCGGPFGPDVACQACGQVAGLPVGVRLSSLGKRFGEYLLEGLLAIVTLGIGWIVWSLIVWQYGQTPAKQVLSMRVLHVSDRRQASYGRMALREFVGKAVVGCLLSLLFYIPWLIGVLLIFGGVRRQPFWDRIADTVVIDDPR